MSLRFLPNFLSVARILIIPFIFFQLSLGHPLNALLLFSMATFTDFLDGYLARKLKATTKMGALLDPIADKVLLVALLSFLIQKNLCPFWFLGLVLTTNLILSFGYVIFNWPNNPLTSEFPPLKIAKLNTGLQFAWVSLLILEAAMIPPGVQVQDLILHTKDMAFIGLSVLQMTVFIKYFFHFRLHLSPDLGVIFP